LAWLLRGTAPIRTARVLSHDATMAQRALAHTTGVVAHYPFSVVVIGRRPALDVAPALVFLRSALHHHHQISHPWLFFFSFSLL
jgi:hypothetical protein